MRVGDVLAAHAREPDHRADPEGAFELGFHPLPVLAGVAVVVDQRAFRDQQRAPAVGLQRAALRDQRGHDAGEPVLRQHRARDAGVVRVLLLAAPAVEAEVDAGRLSALLDENRCRVAGPQVVGRDGDDLDVGAHGGLRLVPVRGFREQDDVLEPGHGTGQPRDVRLDVGQVGAPDPRRRRPGHERAGVVLPFGTEGPRGRGRAHGRRTRRARRGPRGARMTPA